MSEDEMMQQAILMSRMQDAARSPKGPSPRMAAERGVHGASQPRVAGPPLGGDGFRASVPRTASPAPGENRRPPLQTSPGGLDGPKAGIGGMQMPATSMGMPATSMGVPRLEIENDVPASTPVQMLAPGPNDVHLGTECESEIDRLVRERLEGGHSHRVNAKRRIEGIADYHNTWQGCIEASLRECAWSILQAPPALLGRLNFSGPNSACDRVSKVMPVVIQGDSKEADIAHVNAPPPDFFGTYDDDFQDLIAPPAAAIASSSARQASPRRISIPSDPPSGLRPPETPLERPVPLASPATPPTDSALSSTAPPEASMSARGQHPAGRRHGDTASALSVSSAMTSSAAQMLGGLAPPRQRTSAPAPSSNARSASVENEPSNAASSSEAYQPEGNARSSPDRRDRRSADESKSVLGSTTGMTSSAAAALGSLAASGQRRTDGGNARSASPRVAQSPRDAKSTLAPSAAMTSNAAAALGGLSAGGGSSRGGSSGRRPGGESKTVVSGMNTSSAASGLLGPLVKSQAAPKKRSDRGDSQSVL